MYNKIKRAQIQELLDTYEVSAVLLEDHTFDNSIIGINVKDEDPHVVYSFARMVEEYMTDEDCSEEEAVEWIEYNTLRSIPYMGKNKPEIIEEF